jgi:DNA-binding beta-propeller fold protein YncE
MGLEFSGHIELPENVKAGGFDHATIHRAGGRLYVAHTSNDALDVIDCVADRYLHSIPDLAGVAGALASDEHSLVFTSNRGENTVGIFSPQDEGALAKVSVGIRPNGLAYAPVLNLLLAANIGEPDPPNSFTVSIVDVKLRAMIAEIPVPGRTRWAVYDAHQNVFFANIADPPQIVVIEAATPTHIVSSYPIPAAGPHGLDLDTETSRLFCACDGRKLVVLDSRSGQIMAERDIGGVPDVIFLNAALHHLYIAIGDPGLVEVYETEGLGHIETMPTERGAHTLAFDPDHNRVYAFLPETHRVAVYRDNGD